MADCYGGVQIVSTYDLKRQFNLRAEAPVRTSVYPDQWLPRCPVQFNLNYTPTAKADCPQNDVISFARLDVVSNAGVNTPMLSVGTMTDKPVSVYLKPFTMDGNNHPIEAHQGDETYYLMGSTRDKRFNFYVYLEHDPVPPPSNSVFKTFRLEIFDQKAPKECLDNEPDQNNVFWALEDTTPLAPNKAKIDIKLIQRWKDALDARAAKFIVYNVYRIDETQVGDGSEPRHQ